MILTNWKDGKKDIVIPIHLNKNGSIKVENAAASAYQTKHIQSFLGDQDQNVLYTKNGEDIHQLLSEGVQFPQAMADDVLAKEPYHDPGGMSRSNFIPASKKGPALDGGGRRQGPPFKREGPSQRRKPPGWARILPGGRGTSN